MIVYPNILHHSWFPQTCTSSSICTLSPPLKGSLHKISPCHLYKHSKEVGQGGSRQKKVQLVCISASGTSLISLLRVLAGMRVLHFESGCPRKTIKINKNFLLILQCFKHTKHTKMRPYANT